MNNVSASPTRPRDMLCVVLSFNGFADTAACLDSLKAGASDGFDVLVVDNASQHGVVEMLEKSYPDIELLALPENLGWAGGNNIGIKIGLERGYRWICLLNNDTVFPDKQVAAWLEAAGSAPPCLLHPSIYYWDEPEIAQLHPDVDDFNAKYPMERGSKLFRMKYAYGACLAVHRDVFERIGLLDERFFLQLEETDFYLRARDAGFESLCNASVKIFHKESRAFGGTKAAIKTYYTTRNSLLLIEKNHHGIAAKLDGIKQLFWTLSTLAAVTERQSRLGRFAFTRWLFSRAPSARAIRIGTKDYLQRRFGKAPDSFREQLAKDEQSYAAFLDQKA